MSLDYDRSSSYSYSRGTHGDGYTDTQLQPYYDGGGAGGGGQLPRPQKHELRCYSASYAQSNPTQVGNPDDPNIGKPKKGKIASGSGSGSKYWSMGDPELLRKKRVASYKMYGVEGKMKGSFRKSLRWIKQRYSQVIYGWQ